MKFAQDLRSGQVVEMNGKLLLITKAEFSKSGRNASVMKFKFKNVETGSTSEGIYKTDEKFIDITLDRKEVQYSYRSGDTFVFMDSDFNQYEVSEEFVEGALKYLQEEMSCEIVFHEGKALSIELPTKIVRKIVYTEPAARGDTSGKVMKLAKLESGFEISVPAFIDNGELIEIDTRTDEYVARGK